MEISAVSFVTKTDLERSTYFTNWSRVTLQEGVWILVSIPGNRQQGALHKFLEIDSPFIFLFMLTKSRILN